MNVKSAMKRAIDPDGSLNTALADPFRDRPVHPVMTAITPPVIEQTVEPTPAPQVTAAAAPAFIPPGATPPAPIQPAPARARLHSTRRLGRTDLIFHPWRTRKSRHPIRTQYNDKPMPLLEHPGGVAPPAACGRWVPSSCASSSATDFSSAIYLFLAQPLKHIMQSKG